MNRDIANIVRDLEDKTNNDIIWKKNQIEKALYEDPDLLEILGSKEKRPLNKFADPSNPTEEELNTRKIIEEYNEKITHKQIVPYLRLGEIQKEVLNFIMFDIRDNDVSYTNNVIKDQQLIVMCLVSEDDMETEYGVLRTDLLSYIIRDLFCWSNSLGLRLKLVNDYPDIIDARYYSRTMKFKIEAVNTSGVGVYNRHDRFSKI